MSEDHDQVDEARTAPGDRRAKAKSLTGLTQRDPNTKHRRAMKTSQWWKYTGPGGHGHRATGAYTAEGETEIVDATHVDAPVAALHAYDVLAAAAAGKPADAQAIFNELLADRIAEFVATRRDEMATEVFGGTGPEDEDEQEDMFGTDDEILDEPAGDEPPAADDDETPSDPTGEEDGEQPKDA